MFAAVGISTSSIARSTSHGHLDIINAAHFMLHYISEPGAFQNSKMYV
jgi:hypothetical protein